MLLPTPPLPLATATTCFTPLIFVAPGEDAAGGFFRSMSTCGVRTPGKRASAPMHSRWICWATFGSSTASESFTKTSSPRTSADSTSPNDTISRLKPGYFTARRASRTFSALTSGISSPSCGPPPPLKRIFSSGSAGCQAFPGISPPCGAPRRARPPGAVPRAAGRLMACADPLHG